MRGKQQSAGKSRGIAHQAENVSDGDLLCHETGDDVFDDAEEKSNFLGRKKDCKGPSLYVQVLKKIFEEKEQKRKREKSEKEREKSEKKEKIRKEKERN